MPCVYLAGRWYQFCKKKKKRPYLEYRCVIDSKTRPEHRRWHRIILPVDHPFWKTHYPPNGWNCRCTVRTYSVEELNSLGLNISDDPEILYWDVIDKDGVITDRVPVGIDAGWDHNVGESWLQPEIALGRKLASLPMEIQPAAIRQSITNDYRKVLSERWQDWYEQVRTDGKPRGNAQIVGFLPDGVTRGLANAVPDFKLESITVGVFDRRTVHLEGTHKIKKSASQIWPADWINRLPELMGDYRAVLWDIQHQTLIVVPKGNFNNTIPKISLRPNANYKGEKVLSVVSLGSASIRNFKQAEYVLVAGKLEEKW